MSYLGCFESYNFVILLSLVPKDGVEHSSDVYEVLCKNTTSWNYMYSGNKIKNAIIGGSAGNGEPFYVCSGFLDGQKIPGKFYKPTGCCYVALLGKEYCAETYLYLTTSEYETYFRFPYYNSTSLYN